MTDLDLKNECMEDAEIDLTRYTNNELTQIREAMRMYADRKLKLFDIPDVIKSLPEPEEIRMKARELDEKDFAQWMYELQKGNVL